MNTGTSLTVAIICLFYGTIVFAQEQAGLVDPPTPKREKLFFSIGAGFAHINSKWTSANDVGESSGQDIGGGVSTNFRLGFAVNEKLLIFYNNSVIWTSETTLENNMTYPRSSTFAYGITSVGISVFKKSDIRSIYASLALGQTGRVDSETYRRYAEKGFGLGFLVGVGYQFAPRWTVESNLIVGKGKGRPKYDSDWEIDFYALQLSVNYIWFKGYKKKKKERKG